MVVLVWISVLLFILGICLYYTKVESVTSPHTIQDHLTPPHHIPGIFQKSPDDISFAQKIARWFWSSDEEDNDREVKVKVNGKHIPNQQPKQQPPQPQTQVNQDGVKGSPTNLMTFWVAPSQSQKFTRHAGGRSEENCNPCNKFPWVPVPRALPAVPAILSSHGDQFSLTIPAISLQYGTPAQGSDSPKTVYGAPASQTKPVQSFNSDFGGKPPPPPPLPSSPPHQPQYNPPPVHKPKPSQTYGIPSDLGKIPLSYASPSALSYPPNVQYSAPSAPIPQKVHPLLIHTPIPFPSMSQGPLPPLFQYQPFNEGALSSYLQPPAPSTIQNQNGGEEDCRKCSSEHTPDDSVAAQAQNQETGAQLQKLPNTGIEVMKSVPLAEYLSSVEYPMQIVQAPIVDVGELPKYINLRFPANKAPSFLQHSGHALFVNHDLKPETSTPPPDNVISASSHENQLPESNRQATPSSLSTSTTPEPRQSTIFTSSSGSTLKSSTFTTSNIPLTSTSRPTYYSTITDLMPPLPDPPQNFFRKYNTSLDQIANAQAAIPSSMRYLNPPPLRATPSPIDWSRPTTSQTFTYSSTIQPRFPSQRPNILSTPGVKKTKQVHQIIVPYTIKNTNDGNFNEQLWTPVPPQGRKVPNESVKFDPYRQNTTYVATDLNLGESRPITSTASEHVQDYKIPVTDEGVTPELVSQLLSFEEGSQNSIKAIVHPGDVHHVLAANLRALLRGEEDNVDLQRLQKNIDNWTAEGYKTNSPPENFHTLSTLGHLSPSKNIPEEYFTTPSIFVNHNDDHDYGNKDIKSNYYTKLIHRVTNSTNVTRDSIDHEPSGSQNHPVRTSSQIHVKAIRHPADEYESWSLLDTKLKSGVSLGNFISTSSVSILPETTSSSPITSTTTSEPTSKAWEQLQVSISPLTKEKVYVVTPQPINSDSSEIVATTPLINYKSIPTSITSTRVDRSYSIETGKRSTQRQDTPTEKTPIFRGNTQKTDSSAKPTGSRLVTKVQTTMKTLKDSSESIDPIEDSRFGIKLVPDGKSNRLRRYQDSNGYFRFFPELLKASDYLEDSGDIEQIRRVALELKKEGSES